MFATFRSGRSSKIPCPQQHPYILCAGSEKHKECGRWVGFRQKSGSVALGTTQEGVASSLLNLNPICGHTPNCRRRGMGQCAFPLATFLYTWGQLTHPVDTSEQRENYVHYICVHCHVPTLSVNWIFLFQRSSARSASLLLPCVTHASR